MGPQECALTACKSEGLDKKGVSGAKPRAMDSSRETETEGEARYGDFFRNRARCCSRRWILVLLDFKTDLGGIFKMFRNIINLFIDKFTFGSSELCFETGLVNQHNFTLGPL